MMDVTQLEGVGVQPSCSRKRKRSTRPTNTPEGGIAPEPSNGLETEGTYIREEPTSEMPQVQADVTMQYNQHSSEALHSLADEYNYETYGDDDREEGEHIGGDGEEGEDIDDGQHGEGEGYDIDDDDDDAPGCVEGRIEPGRVHAFLHGEENRKFRSKVWAEFTKVRVAGIVTKGQCIHCNTEISAKRGTGTSSMGNHLKRCKARRSVANMARQLRSVVMSPEGVALDN